MTLALIVATHSRTCRVQLVEREEAPVAQLGQHEALDDQNRDLDLRLVAWLPHPRRQHHEAVVVGEILIGAVDARLVARRLGDAGLEVVAHNRLRHAADRGERVHMRADPVGQRLGPARFGVGVVRRAERRDEDVRAMLLARRGIEHRRWCRRPNRRTASRRPHASGASSARCASASRCSARRTSCRRSLRRARRDTPARAAPASRRAASAPHGCATSPDRCAPQTNAAAVGGNNRRSSSASSISSGSGQLRPATAARRTYSPTAVLPIPVASPTSRRLIPSACVRRSTSRIFLIDTLSAGIGHPLVARETDQLIRLSTGAPLYAAITRCPQSPECCPPCAGIGVRVAPDSAQIVRDEFARNKDRIMKEGGRSLSGALKRARAALWTYGDPNKRKKAVEALDDIDHRLASSIDVTAQAVGRIKKLFANSICCPTNDQAILQASSRALEKKAPFHNGKNNFADAVIIELYGQMVAIRKGRSVFVTHNTKDFSVPNGDQRLPHPDIAYHFSRVKSRYFIKLVDALRALQPQHFLEAMYEYQSRR